MSIPIDAARAAFFAVINVTVERGYPGDPLSVPREAVDFTVHGTSESAAGRLLAELDFNLTDGSAYALRRSFLIEVEVPETMCHGGSPHRWISDRLGVLLRQAGVRPGDYAAAVARDCGADLLSGDLADAVINLRAALGDGQQQETATLAMQAAGAAARAMRLGAVPPPLARKITGAVKAIGAAAWAGEDVEHLAPALDALLAELPRPATTDEGTVAAAA